MEQNSSSHHSDSGANGDNNIELRASHSLLFRLFAHLLTNSAVQTGLRQITRLTQPIIGKFDDNIVKITSNVSRWVSHENIYNQFTNVWLAHNYPFSGTVETYETFTKEFEHMLRNGKRHENEFALKHFYNFACETWKSLSDPHNDDIKNALLATVAKVINRSYHFEEDTLSSALYNVLRMLVEKRGELVSSESFFNLVKTHLGEEYYQSNQQIIRAACKQYYVFAKRFILIDFPLATNSKDVLKLIFDFLQDNGYYYGDSALTFIEKKLDLLLRLSGQNYAESTEDKTLAEKAHRIFGKALTLSGFPIKLAQDGYHKAQTTRLYITADKYLHITNRVNDAVHFSELGYNLVKERVLVPSFERVRIIKDKVTKQVTVVIHGLDIQLLKKKYNRLHAQYEVLQKCVVLVADESVKLIFDKQALAELGENGKKELQRLYSELKDLETQKIKDISLEYYARILKKAQETYNNARKAVYYRKREMGDQDAASAVRPSKDKEVDDYDNKSHPHNVAGRDATESVALEAH